MCDAQVGGGRAGRWAAAVVLLIYLAGCGGGPDDRSEGGDGDRGLEVATGPLSIADVGFDTPESAVHDEIDDVYLISNIGGDPIAKANNGFISRISASGEVLALRWIAGGQAGVTLHAPKGLALKGDSLFVTDIDSLRIFHRRTGEALGAWGASGAGFLNDPVVAGDGSIFVSDSGLRAGAQGLEPSGTDAIFRFAPDGTSTAVVRGPDLQNPNGLEVDGGSILMVPFGGTQAFSVDPATGDRTAVANLPADQLDGLIRLDDGTLFVSSWGGQAVFRVRPTGEVEEVASGISSPADLGYDATRGRLVVPVFTENRVLFVDVR